MRKIIGILCAILFVLNIQGQQYIGNPVITDIFTADPSALVYNDTLFLFTGHDEQNTTNKWFYMRNWHVFSTDNMYHYKDHGALLRYTDFDWAAGNAFAGHCQEYNGKFWWYVPMTHKSIKVNQGFAIGVAVADHPLGPYKDAKGEPIITDETENSIALNIDPTTFVDDDGRIYMYWGSWGACRMVELDTNMIDTIGAVQTIHLKNFFEAPWVHKRGNIYYMSYAGSGYPSKTEYCTSKSIHGPWTYKGVINGLMPKSETNHQAIVEYKDEWYFIYHSSSLPNGGVYRRSVCIDKLEYTADSLIKRIVRTKTSVPSLTEIINIENLNNSQFKVFPNPAQQGNLNIRFERDGQDKPKKLEIYSITGAKVFEDQIYPSQKNIHLELSQDIYIIKFISDTQTICQKLIVN